MSNFGLTHGWRAVCPENGEPRMCNECKTEHPHHFEKQVDGYVSEHGRLVGRDERLDRCPHDGRRLMIAGEA